MHSKGRIISQIRTIMWQQWINLVLGVWAIVSAYIFSGAALVTDFTITGLIVAILALWGALQHQMRESSGDAYHRHA